jgi:hypothetical protein
VTFSPPHCCRLVLVLLVVEGLFPHSGVAQSPRFDANAAASGSARKTAVASHRSGLVSPDSVFGGPGAIVFRGASEGWDDRRPAKQRLGRLLSTTDWTEDSPASEELDNDQRTDDDREPISPVRYDPQNVREDPGSPFASPPVRRLFEGPSGPSMLPPQPFPPLPGERDDVDDPALAEPAATPPPVIPASTIVLLTVNPGGGDQVGITHLELREMLLFPRWKGFFLIPGFGINWLSGPTTTDVPAHLYEAYVEGMWIKPINERWTVQLAVSPTMMTDFENTSGRAWRITGRALAFWQINPVWQLAFGAVYLDREDLRAVPAAGLVVTPHEDWRIEAIFPRPRVAYRLTHDDDRTRWIYVGGEFTGGSYAIERASGARDVVTYNALMLLAGYEVKRQRGFAPRAEVGWTFDRTLDYQSGVGNLTLDSVAFLRIGASF